VRSRSAKDAVESHPKSLAEDGYGRSRVVHLLLREVRPTEHRLTSSSADERSRGACATVVILGGDGHRPTCGLAVSESTLGVGIIGVSPVRGWAATAHIPALRALPNYEIRALSAHSAESARAAGEVFGVIAAFSDHEQLVSQPDIDVVAVTVRAPLHRELVSAALAAGKAVYCEWPLGRDLDDARAMAALAAEQRMRTVAGLQARQAPAIEFVQQLLSDGFVGEVLSTTIVGLSVLGEVLGQPNAYMLDETNGANVLTIAVGHSLDILNHVLGEYADLSAVSGIRRPLITIEETGEQIVKTAADQIAVIGTLTSGATASIHIREAVAGGTGFLWEINGTDGTLRITAEAAQPQIYPLTIAGAKGPNEPTEFAVPAALIRKWPALTSLEGAPAYNVGRAYAAFAADIENGTHTVPDFADAVRRHEVIAAIERSAESGERVKA
jgi:predicted dehydrogenase